MASTIRRNPLRQGVFVAFCLSLAACAGSDVEYSYPRTGPQGQPTYEERQSVFGEDGLVLFGSSQSEESGSGGIGVNSFLWRASLDTLAFMPISSADPFGGVILTDWYSSPDTSDERFKVNIFILDRTLRADGIRASVFRQERDSGEGWIDASVDPKLGTDLENTILTRARELRVRTARPE